MEITTTETMIERQEKRSRRPATGNGAGDRGGPGRGGGENGDGPDGGAEPAAFVPGKARVFTGFLLVVVLMTFGGLSAAYIMTATNKAVEWHPFELPIQVWISTAIILISSYVYHRGRVALNDHDQRTAKRWLTATAVFGAGFISSQLLAWLELTRQGLYFSGNPYAGFFYILTAVHALHVLGGVIALGSVVIGIWNDVLSGSQWLRLRSLGQVVGWYWHFMGGVWLVLFVLLGFWK
jgi:cytochrome c oxidase subunit 3